MPDNLPAEFFEPLPEDEYRQYEALVYEQVFKGQQPVEKPKKPKAYIMAGQPGAGKGVLRQALEEKEPDAENFVTIDPDDYRHLHFRYNKYNLENSEKTAEWTHHDASKAAAEMRGKAISGGFNLIIDGTLKDTQKALELVKELKINGYEVHIMAMCVHPAISWQGCQERFHAVNGTVDKNGNIIYGRSVPKKVHDAAIDPMVRSLEEIAWQGLADSITVKDRKVNKDKDGKVNEFFVLKPRSVRKNVALKIIEIYNLYGGRKLQPVEKENDLGSLIGFGIKIIRRFFTGG